MFLQSLSPCVCAVLCHGLLLAIDRDVYCILTAMVGKQPKHHKTSFLHSILLLIVSEQFIDNSNMSALL